MGRKAGGKISKELEEHSGEIIGERC